MKFTRLKSAILDLPFAEDFAFLAMNRRIQKGRIYQTNQYVVHAHQAIYLAIFKSGSSSILQVFSELLNMQRETKRGYIPGIPLSFVHRYSDYFKFSFVRNPWARMVSAYHFMILRNRKKNIPLQKIFRYLPEAFRADMDFSEFLNTIDAKSAQQGNGHIRLQSSFLKDRKDRWLPDFVGKMENFEEDFSYVRRQIKIPDQILLRRINASSPYDYRNFYTPDLQKRVQSLYQEDIERFGYEF